MRILGLKSVIRKKRPDYIKSTPEITAENILNRDFKATALYPDAKPIFHSDRGFQYTNKVFHQKLVDAGMIQSMSRVGRCLDNAPMEGRWGILKSEMYYLKKFTSRESLVSAIENYIHFYNTRRYQQRLNCMTPCEYYFATAA